MGKQLCLQALHIIKRAHVYSYTPPVADMGACANGPEPSDNIQANGYEVYLYTGFARRICKTDSTRQTKDGSQVLSPPLSWPENAREE